MPKQTFKNLAFLIIASIILGNTVISTILFPQSTFAHELLLLPSRTLFADITTEPDERKIQFDKQGFSVELPATWYVKVGNSFGAHLPTDTVALAMSPTSFDISIVSLEINHGQSIDIEQFARTVFGLYRGIPVNIDSELVPSKTQINSSIRQVVHETSPYGVDVIALSEFVMERDRGYWISVSYYAQTGTTLPLYEDDARRLQVFEQVIKSFDILTKRGKINTTVGHEEIQQVDKAIVQLQTPKKTETAFLWPTTGYVHWLYKQPTLYGIHNGVDIWTNTTCDQDSTSRGNPVYPVASGYLDYLYHLPTGEYDGVRIDYGEINGVHVWTHYWHLASFNPQTHQRTSFVIANIGNVDTQTVVGYQGNLMRNGSGGVTTTCIHLHITVANGNADHNDIDPSPYFEAELYYGKQGAVPPGTYVEHASGFGDIGGQVKDLNNNPVAGANVKFSNADTNETTTTDGDGTYLFSNIPAGQATITAVRDNAGGSIDVVVLANQSQSAPDIVLDACIEYGTRGLLTDCAPSDSTDNATFVTDVTLPDGTVVAPGEALVKTWRLRNAGTSTWGSGYKLVFISGEQMGAPSEVDIPTAARGDEVDISVNLTAPVNDGSYRGYWQLRNPQGTYFGDEIWVDITVSGTPSPSSNDVELVCTNCPAVVSPGETFRPIIAATVNSGQLLESRGDMLRNTDGNLFGAWPHVAVVGTVNTGQTYNFEFYEGSPITAPDAEGHYESKWRVWRDGNYAGEELAIGFDVRNGGGTRPAPPSLVSPGDWYVSIDGSTPTLCASAPSGLEYYFQIYESHDIPESGWISSNCWTPPGLGNYGYQWRVKVRDPGTGLESGWSETWHFNIESGDITITDIHFDIPSPSDAERVRIYASTSGCGGQNVGMQVLINTANDGTTNGDWNIIYELGVPEFTDENAPYWDTRPYEDGTHLVRILAKGCTDPTWEDGTYRDEPYTLLHRPPSWPPLTAPENEIWLTGRTVTFQWQYAPRTTTYQLFASTNSDPETDSLINQTFDSNTFSYTFIFDQDYTDVYWYIKAFNELGSNTSFKYHFGIDPDAPNTSVNALSNTTYQTTFAVSWSGNDTRSGIRWYDVQVRDGAQGEWADWLVHTTDTIAVFTGLPGHTYYFRSRGLDNAGNLEAYPSGDGDTWITMDLTTRPPQTWWDGNYSFRRELVLLNNDSHTLPAGFPIRLYFDSSTNPTAAEIYNASVSAAKGDDVRIIYNNSIELPRYIRSFTSSSIEIWFDAYTDIPAYGTHNAHYQIYYGNNAAVSPTHGINDVFSPPVDANTVGLWHFQEGNGTIIHDTSGSGHNGAAYGASPWELDPPGHFINFNRDAPHYGDYVDVGSINLSQFTLEAWIKLRDLGWGGAIVSKWGGSGNNSYNFAIWNSRIGLQLSGPGGNREIQSQSVQPAVGQWQHVAATYDGSYMRIYVNGQMVAERNDTGGVYSSATPTVIGRSNDGPGGIWYFQGGIANVRVSNIARTEFPYANLRGITNMMSVEASAEEVYEPPVSGSPDLAILDVSVYPNLAENGGGTLVQVVVQNQGDAATQNNFYTNLYLDHVPTGTDDYTGSVQFWINDSIEANEILTLTTVLRDVPMQNASLSVETMSPEEQSGTIYVQTDSTGILNESAEDNNIYSDGIEACFATSDVYENDDTVVQAQPINDRQSQAHNFDGLGDEDWLYFTATEGVTYTIQTFNLGIASDTYLYLYDTDGTTLLAANDDYGNSLASRIDWGAPASGVYYVLVKHWNPNIGGCGTRYNIKMATGFDVFLPIVANGIGSPNTTPAPTPSPTPTPTPSPTPVLSYNWTLVGSGGPSARSGHTMVLDTLNSKLVIYGGTCAGFACGDTWVYGGSSWQEITGTGPSAREEGIMTYDTLRQKTVLFGGHVWADGYLADTWEFDGASWTQVSTTTCPPARAGQAMAYDLSRNRIVIFGGWQGGANYLGDTWEYDGSNWQPIITANSPSPRRGARMVFVPEMNKIILFGGLSPSLEVYNDTWVYDGQNWAQLTTANSPAARYNHQMVYNPASSTILLFGGYRLDTGAQADTWEFTNSNWRQKTPANSPPATWLAGIAYYPPLGGIVMHGGNSPGQNDLSNEMWLYGPVP